MTAAQHLARAVMLYELAALAKGSTSGTQSPARVLRKVRAAYRLQKWAEAHLHAAGGWAFQTALTAEKEAWNARWDRRAAARARRKEAA